MVGTNVYIIMDNTNELKSIFRVFYLPQINECLGKVIANANKSHVPYINFFKIDGETYFSYRFSRFYALSNKTQQRIANKLNMYEYKIAESIFSDHVSYEISGRFIDITY